MNKKMMGRPPAGGRVEAAAGTTPSAVGQQAEGAGLGVIVSNDRDQRTLAWLREEVGDANILAAVYLLEGARQPYLSNICKALGVQPPERLAYVDKETAVARLTALREKLTS
jgi:hypothetical protein